MPLNDLDRELLRDKLEFLKKNAVTPPDGVVSKETNRNDVLVDGIARKYTSVANPDYQIGYGHLHRVNDDWADRTMKLIKPESVYIDVKYRNEIDVSQEDEYVKFYWLPWDQRGGVVKISLIVPPPRPGKRALPDPDLFFTAALSGCSIFVRGSRKHPTVYHAGITGAAPGDPGDHWRKLYKEIVPEEDRKVENIHEVNTLNYVDKKNRPLKDVADYKKFLTKQQKNEVEAKIVHSWGCVFGIRDDNMDWSFYYQQNVCVTYQKMRRTSFWNRLVKDNTPPRTINYPMRVNQFYPGSDHVHVTPFKKVPLS
jgi:hypothetical protein